MNKKWYWVCVVLLLLALLTRQALFLILDILTLLVLAIVHAWSSYGLTDLRFARRLSARNALFGSEVTLSVTVENAKILPLPWLEIEDAVPRSLRVRGRRLRVQPTTNRSILETLFSVRWYEQVTRQYTLVCIKRGIHTFGPTSLRTGDLFGFTERSETLENQQYLTVYPLILPLNSFNLPARHPFGDRRAPRRLLEDPSRMIGVRDYVYGDDLRRVHWKATARAMTLQSKIYEPTTTYTLALFLNISSQLNVFTNPTQELLELAVCAAASVTDWGFREGYAVGFYSNGYPYIPEMSLSSQIESASLATSGDSQRSQRSSLSRLKDQKIRLPPSSNQEQRRRIMEALARQQPFSTHSFESILQSEEAYLPAGTTVVVISAVINDPLLDRLRHLRQVGHTVTLLFVSDQAVSMRLNGIPVHHLGGSETWQRLAACYNLPEEESALLPEKGEQQKVLSAFNL